MTSPLADCWAKLDWAKQRIEAYQRDFVVWIQNEGESSVDFLAQYDPQQKCFLCTIGSITDTPARWSLRLGDALYNLRSTLDYLAWLLVKITNTTSKMKPGQQRRIQFPIFTHCHNFECDFRNFLPNIRPEHLAIIKSHQPYHWRNRAQEHPLALLDDLCNKDKHRELQPTLVRLLELSVEKVVPQGCTIDRIEPCQINWLTLKPGTELVRIYITPIGNTQPDVKVLFDLTASVVLENGMMIDDALNWIGVRVFAILREIEPLL